MKSKGKSRFIFIFCTVIIFALAFIGFRGAKIGGWEVKPFEDAITKGLDLQGGVSVLLGITDKDVSQDDLEKTKNLIELRVNKIGVAETVVTTEGSDRIRVDIPGEFNSQKIVDTLSKTGNLTFKSPNGDVILTGKDIKEASAVIDNQSNKPVVSLKLNEEGTKKFSEATKKYMGQSISIYMDDEMLTNPVVQSQITNGEAVITGSKDIEEAKNLSSLINSGALPVTIKALSTETVGAQLGASALPNAMKAGAIGIGLIFVFMILYYRGPGVIASIALTLYVVLVLLIYVEIGATLTLPGIAGFLLTIGMAVDANVLIFERIREELKKGVSVKAAIKRGFENAMSSIVDSNITTIIAALVLYFFGSGAVKGFAITLLIGIVVSLFTALVVTKFLMNNAVNAGFLTKPSQFRVKRG